MTSPARGRPPAGRADLANCMLPIATELAAAGFAADLNETMAGLDVTAAVGQPGRETEVIIDQDGYIELRWWIAPGATAEEVATTITRAVAITSAPIPTPDCAGPCPSAVGRRCMRLLDRARNR
jgi:hypothetical protein